MGLIRGGLLWIVCILLFFSLLTLNSLLAVSSSLEYPHVQEQLTPLVQNITNPQPDTPFLEGVNLSEINLSKAIEDNRPAIDEFCANYSNYTFAFQNYTISIPCNAIQQNPESLVNETVNSFVQEIYYKDYNCGFWDCFNKDSFPFFLISQKAQEYWKSKFWISLMVSLVLIALMFLFLENRLNLPIVTGIILVLASLPMIKLSSILGNFLGSPFIILFNIFFSQAQRIFWISFFIGVFLFGAGIALRFVESGPVKWIASKIDSKSQQSKTEPKQVVQDKPKEVKKGKKK